MIRRVHVTVGLLLLVLGCSAAALGQAWQFSLSGPIVTQHHVVVNGESLAYNAEVGRIAIRDVETGVAHGYMFYTAYSLPSADKPRPVMFIWNGGPGANSSTLHFRAAGPKLLQDGKFVDNGDTWLQVADLVFVDPIGTGFSRPAASRYAAEFYGTVGDVASVREFVRCWLVKHDALDAPVYLIGESWGAGRAAHVAADLEQRGITVSGLVLISGGFGLVKDYAPPILKTALGVVDMATIAYFWNKTGHELGDNVKKVRRNSEQWVRTVYVPALQDIDSLSPAERTEIAQQLSRFTGIATGKIDKKTLIITPSQFRKNLLQKRDEVLYTLDGRRTQPPKQSAVPAMLNYFRHTLGYRTDLLYLGMGGTGQPLRDGYAPNNHYPRPVNERWNYATAPVSSTAIKKAVRVAVEQGSGPPQLGPPLPGTEAALALNPNLKVLVLAGMYDTFLQCARGKEVEHSLPVPFRDAVKFHCFRGGHAMYLGQPEIRKKLTQYIGAFVTASTIK